MPKLNITKVIIELDKLLEDWYDQDRFAWLEFQPTLDHLQRNLLRGVGLLTGRDRDVKRNQLRRMTVQKMIKAVKADIPLALQFEGTEEDVLAQFLNFNSIF